MRQARRLVLPTGTTARVFPNGVSNLMEYALGAQVEIKMGAKNKGKMTIAFANLDILDGIIHKIVPNE